MNKYQPELPSQYKGQQIILSSGRILFNAKSDSIMLSSNKAISLSTKGTFNIDSDDYSIINSPKIYLGLQASSEKEPLLLGTKTNNLLKDLITAIEGFTELVRSGGGTPQSLMAGVGLLEGRVREIKFFLNNKELLSKQNFTI